MILDRTLAVLAAFLLAAPLHARQLTPAQFIERSPTGRMRMATVLEWTGRAVVYTPNGEVRIRGTWQVKPPDSAIVATYAEAQGPGSTRTLIVTGNQGWLKRDTSLSPLSPELLAEERHQCYLYSLLRLVPLLDPNVELEPVPNDSEGHQGFTVTSPGRLPVTLYFHHDGRVIRMVTTFATVTGAPGDAQEVQLSGTVSRDGVNWFGRMKIYRGGNPYFDLVVGAFRPLSHLTRKL